MLYAIHVIFVEKIMKIENRKYMETGNKGLSSSTKY